MIFITLGSQKFQFNRLLKELDDLVEQGIIEEEIFAQIGYSDYKPINYNYSEFLDRNEFKRIMNNCDIVITHGGTGAIITAIKQGKKVIAIPRLAKYREHVDDHQVEIVNAFENSKIIKGVYEIKDLKEAIENIYKLKFANFISNTDIIIKDIEKYLEG